MKPLHAHSPSASSSSHIHQNSGGQGQTPFADNQAHLPPTHSSPVPVPPGAGRSTFLNKINSNYLRAQNRLNKLFSRKSPHDYQASVRAIDFYLHRNSSAPVPARVRNLMILLDSVSHDVHQAIPYGRGNVLIRNRNALVPTESGKHPLDFNRSEVAGKAYLKELGEEIFQRLDEEMFDTDEEERQAQAHQIGACAILTGSSGCYGYAALFAAAAAYRCAEAGIDNVTIDIVKAPELNGKRVDHVICRVAFPLQDGSHCEITHDPWGNVSTLFSHHSPYKNGNIHCSFHSGDFPDSHKKEILSYMEEGSSLIPEVKNSSEFNQSFSDMRDHIVTADPRKSYSLEETHGGLSSIEALSMVQPGVQVIQRRASILSPRDSDLLSRGHANQGA